MNIRWKFLLMEMRIFLFVVILLGGVAMSNYRVAEKLDRAASDMQTIQKALIAFHIGTNQYPYMSNDTIRMNHQYPGLSLLDPSAARISFAYAQIEAEDGIRHLYLTTPVAYLLAIPFDPFRGNGHAFSYGYGSDGNTYYILTSYGPDKADGLAGVVGGELNEFEFSVRLAYDRNLNTKTGRYTLSQLQYDPSNGTYSKGDLILVGP